MVVRAAGFVIFRRPIESIEYLLMQASYEPHHWTPPKGHVEQGESDLETAFRETREESGLKKDHLKVYDAFQRTLSYNVKGKPKEVVYWLAELVNDKAQVLLSKEHQDFAWLPLKEAQEYAKYTEMQELLKECEDFLKS